MSASTTIEINGKRVAAELGEMLIKASDRAGIYIPRFCYHEQLSIAANCRMCLVEVEKAPKPLPACATPVTEGMKVFTASKLAREAQQGTLEFLLINHPLDCPVCDQGGECPLQDQAMGYGKDASRFTERKRAVPSHDLGPLVATEMTRCIHCTRCVRFGEEIAGLMEFGFPGRNEAAHIATFLNRTLDSEVSGNMIDLCPVGALTSKPYRFAARSWELENHRSISPHDCVGSNINIQTLRGRVERVLPIENPQVNSCWLADRDRYSYQAVNSAQRLRKPLIKQRGAWQPVSWEKALQFACAGINKAGGAASGVAGGSELGVLAGYTSTLEEYYLLQKLARALGSNHIDHRLQQRDFRDDAVTDLPISEVPIHQFDDLRAALLVGSNLRKEQPLLALRLRAAARNLADGRGGARISVLNPLAYAQNFAVETAVSVGAQLPARLAGVAAQLAAKRGAVLPDDIQQWVDATQPAAPAIADSLLAAGADGVVLLGALAQQHADASAIKGIAQWLCHTAGSRLAILPPGNSVAAWRAGCVPRPAAPAETGATAATAGGGYNVAAMFDNLLRAYLLLATDPELDCIHGNAGKALRNAEFVACITAYQSEAAREYADVLLPMAAFTESSGTFINCEGRAQPAHAATSPLGESRPAWKILRVLGNFFDLPGFDYVTLPEVTAEVGLDSPTTPNARRAWLIPPPQSQAAQRGLGVQRLLDMPIYRGDQIVRNAPALQKTADNPPPAVRMNQAMMEQYGFAVGEQVVLRDDTGSACLPLQVDRRVPQDCVYVPAGYPQTAQLGGAAAVTLEKA